MLNRRADGALEAEVLSSLWRARRPVTVAEVRSAMGDGLAYTTVMTVLSRLCTKGLVDRRPAGRAFEYSAAVSESELAARRMREALTGARDRRGALLSFVGNLGARDERTLRRILSELEGET